MKYVIGLVLCSTFWMACQSKEQLDREKLAGNWKIDKVSFGGKDISKSSDPTQENGFWFDTENGYRRFGNAAHRDTGRYVLDGQWLSFTSQQDSVPVNAAFRFVQDSLQLVFPMEEDDTLKMRLYKMEG